MKEEERPRNQIGVDMAQDKHNKIAQSSIKQSFRRRNIAQGPHKARITLSREAHVPSG